VDHIKEQLRLKRENLKSLEAAFEVAKMALEKEKALIEALEEDAAQKIFEMSKGAVQFPQESKDEVILSILASNPSSGNGWLIKEIFGEMQKIFPGEFEHMKQIERLITPLIESGKITQANPNMRRNRRFTLSSYVTPSVSEPIS